MGVSVTLGGTDDELRLAALAFEALAERIDDRGFRRPALLDDLRAHLRAWRCQEGTTAPVELDLGEGGVMSPLLLTRGDAAGLLRLSERSVSRAVAGGRLRAVSEGRSVRFRPKDVKAYADSLSDRQTTRRVG